NPNGGIVRIVGYGCRGEGGANLHRHMGRRAGGPKYRHHNRAEPGQCAHGFILRAAPGPTGTRGRDRGTTRHACAAPSWLGSIWGRGVRCRRAGNGLPTLWSRPFSLRRRGNTSSSRVIRGSSPEHGHQYGEQPVDYAADRPRVPVSALAQCAVMPPRGRIVLRAHATPVIERVPKAVVAGVAHADEHALPALAGDGG